MATIVVDVSEETKRWMDEDAASAGLGGAGDLLREMIRREEERKAKIANIQRLVDEGRTSGVTTRTKEEIRAEARKDAVALGYRL